jgi:hypothetical protein
MILLLDEPFSALDPESRSAFRTDVRGPRTECDAGDGDPRSYRGRRARRSRLSPVGRAGWRAQAAMPQFGARAYLVRSEAPGRLREAQFVAIITPSVKQILAELARGVSRRDRLDSNRH